MKQLLQHYKKVKSDANSGNFSYPIALELQKEQIELEKLLYWRWEVFHLNDFIKDVEKKGLSIKDCNDAFWKRLTFNDWLEDELLKVNDNGQ